MAGHRWTADGQRLGDLPDGPAAGAEQFDDSAAIAVAQGVERVTGEREGGHDTSVTKMLPLSLAATHAICQGAEGGWKRETLTRSQMYHDHADCSETNRHDTHGDQADRDHPDRRQANSDKANRS